METVFSDTGGHKLAFFRNARDSGYVIEAHFIGLSSWKRSRARVAQRVRQGGHDVPDGHLEARYPRTLNNLALLTEVADRLFIYDNSHAERPYALVATFGAGLLLSLRDPVPPWIGPLALDDRISARTRRFTG